MLIPTTYDPTLDSETYTSAQNGHRVCSEHLQIDTSTTKPVTFPPACALAQDTSAGDAMPQLHRPDPLESHLPVFVRSTTRLSSKFCLLCPQRFRHLTMSPCRRPHQLV